MTSKVRWSLPDGVDELLAPKALEVEKLRRENDTRTNARMIETRA